MESPIVAIQDGKIQGNQRTNLDGEKFYSFLGIPFAKPPVGKLRFKAPEPVDPWSGIKDATKEGQPPFQVNEYTLALEGSESDCLHINVYTKTLPVEEQKLKPVMVWIYGGGFKHGTNSPALYGPEYLLTEDIVLVAVNYRLGLLGFLHLNDPAVEVPGNAGLKDQQLGLKWVQKNIKSFNGDPNNVTIFGIIVANVIDAVIDGAMESPIVAIQDGKIQGNQRTNLDGEKFYSFLGIPFAKPPVGKLRFKAPEPVDPWSGIRDATKEGQPSYQFNEFTLALEGSESDCLHINVYTKTLPVEEQKLKPVMVWIYGGAFKHGSNRPALYGPEYLLTEDIVLVAVNYRLGFLGFLHFNDPSLDVPGNAGLKDQQLGLKWVQRNIKYFNGDPNNVTIFGESAGSGSVHYHVVSPSSKGLFHKAILQSGCILNPWADAIDIALKFTQSIKKDIKTEKEALELLQNLPAKELLEEQETFLKKTGSLGILAPNIEYPNKTSVVSTFGPELIISGQYNKVPLMLGYTDREGLLFADYNARKEITGKEDKELDLNTLIHPHMKLEKDDPKRKLIIKKYKDLYSQEKFAKDKYMLLTDYYFVSGIVGAAKLHAKTSSNPVYLYRMSVDAGLNMFKKMTKVNESGASHADDLGYLFNIHLAAEFLDRGPFEEKTIRRFVKLWTNFARTGNPTPEGNDLHISWKPVSEKDVNFLDIGKELTLLTDPESERIKTWKEIFEMSPHTANYL